MDNMRAGAFHPGGPGQYAPMGGQYGGQYAPQGMSPFGAPAGPPQFGQSRGFGAPGAMVPPVGRGGMPPPQAYAPYGQQDYGAGAFYGGASMGMAGAQAYAPAFAAFQ